MKKMLLGVPLVLAACAAGNAPTQTQDAATVADAAGVDIAAIARCVRANATDAELLLLDQGGELAETATVQILQKPSTGACLSESDTGLQRAS